MFGDTDVLLRLHRHLQAFLANRPWTPSRHVRWKTRASLLFLLAIVQVSAAPPAFARATGMSTNYWSAGRVALLPAEIRNRLDGLRRACGEPLKAGALFARSVRDPRSGGEMIALHLHYLQCDKQVFCTGHGCLHEIYSYTRGGYRLVWSGYVDDVEFNTVGSTIELRVTCNAHSRCPYILRWNGHRFVAHSN
jgi:hypothetical protein